MTISSPASLESVENVNTDVGLDRRRRRRTKAVILITATTAATPPITPPIIAPIFTRDAQLGFISGPLGLIGKTGTLRKMLVRNGKKGGSVSHELHSQWCIHSA